MKMMDTREKKNYQIKARTKSLVLDAKLFCKTCRLMLFTTMLSFLVAIMVSHDRT